MVYNLSFLPSVKRTKKEGHGWETEEITDDVCFETTKKRCTGITLEYSRQMAGIARNPQIAHL